MAKKASSKKSGSSGKAEESKKSASRSGSTKKARKAAASGKSKGSSAGRSAKGSGGSSSGKSASKKSTKKTSKTTARKTTKKTAKKTAKKAANKKTAKKAANKKTAGGRSRKTSRASGSSATRASRSASSARDQNASGKKIPTHSPLTKSQLEMFRKMLLEKRRELLGDMTGIEHSALGSRGSGEMMPTHPADLGSDNYEQEFTLGLLESERQQLKEIHQALERIDTGGFGTCLGTGKPIGLPRLKARPWAKYCIDYARMIEKGLVVPGEDDEYAQPTREDIDDDLDEDDLDEEDDATPEAEPVEGDDEADDGFEED